MKLIPRTLRPFCLPLSSVLFLSLSAASSLRSKDYEMNDVRGSADAYRCFATSPTEAEVTSLGENLPIHGESHPSLTEILTNIFEICQHKWVFDFLFNDDVTPLSSLTAPVNMTAAVSSSYQLTSVEHTDRNQPDFVSGGMFDLHMAGDIFFVPAFSVGTITVGFGVQRTSLLGRLEWGLDHNLHNAHDRVAKLRDLDHFRFVRDDEQDTLLVTQEDLKSDILRLDMGRLIRTTQRRRRLVCLYLTAFRNVLKRMVSTSQMVQLSEPLVFLCVSAEDFRPCPFCNAFRQVSPCSCSFTKTYPSHPLDFTVTKANMQRHQGTFQGFSIARYCVNGAPVKSARLANRLFIRRNAERDLIDRLSRWAISDKLKSSNFNLTPYTMPRANSLVGSMESVHDHSDVTKSASIRNEMEVPVPGTNSMRKLPRLSSEHPSLPPPQFKYHELHKTLQEGYGIKNGPRYGTHPSFAHESGACGGTQRPNAKTSSDDPDSNMLSSVAQNSESEDDDEGSSDDNFDAQDHFRSQTTNAFNMNHHVLQMNGIYHGDVAGQNNDGLQSSGRQERGRRGVGMFPCDDKGLTGRISVDAESTLGQLRRQRCGPSLPYHQQGAMETTEADRAGGTVFFNNGQMKEKEMERHRRAELRRQRNREAAQRSNLRRKIKNDTLKRELSETHAKAAELRARELALREENLQLRRKLVSK